MLRSVETIALVGASANEARPSHSVMKFLLAKGYRVHPVNPGLAGKDILGWKAYASLEEVPAPVEMVDIFRAARFAGSAVHEAIVEKDRLGLTTVWMQIGVIDEQAAAMAREAGLTVIMDRCPKIEYGRLFGDRALKPV